jgi:phenylalanyl-tRNA synthetase beta chain
VIVPHSWLAEFIADLPPAAETAELLTGIGLSVEALHDYPGAAPGTLTVRIEAVEPVPASEHLLQARVTDGSDSWTVLTGAPNTRAGLVTAFAPPGTYLPALDVTVQEAVMAGETSQGMLLSPRELGVFDHAGGLLELPADQLLGQDLSVIWPADTLIELELTPNRADAFSMLGVARDLAAKLDVPFKHPAPETAPLPAEVRVDDGLHVRLEDALAGTEPAGCSLFTLQRIDGVSVAPSPVWLQRRLGSIGLRPRNNVVDVTNYVTFELGQPSHAYDRQALGNGTIVARRAAQGEKFTTLGDEQLELDGDDLVLVTPGPAGDEIVGLAGVIGGLHHSVVPGTTSVALEAAHFDPVTIRRTAKRHGLQTDAHYRFERGVDPNLPRRASARIAQLITQVAGGETFPGLSSAGAEQPLVQVPFRPGRVEFLTSVDVPLEVQKRFITALGCEIRDVTRPGEESRWLVTVPSWRFDLRIEEDLIEEVIRLYGFEHIGETIPHLEFVPPETDPTHRRLRSLLAGAGFQEAITYVFTGDRELARAAAPDAFTRLVDPQGVERSVLRTALYPGLLAAAAANHAAPSLALFEVGSVFLEQETQRVALLARGPWIEPGWREGLPLDAFVFTGLLQRLAAELQATLELRNAAAPFLHPGVSASVHWNGQPAGHVGQLHPAVAASFGLSNTFLAELDLPLAGRQISFRDPRRQPHAERDLAVITSEDVSFAELHQRLLPAAGGLLEALVPFDVYTGPQIGEGRRSTALRFTFRHPSRALSDPEVTEFMKNVINTAMAAGYDVRDR